MKTKKPVKEKKKAFKVLAGFHLTKGGIQYGKGDIVKSRENLALKYPNKFRHVPMDAEDGDDDNPRPRKNKKIEKGKIGRDVTKDHPEALEKSLRVYKDADGKFNVAHEEAKYALLNQVPLSRPKLAKFITDFNPETISEDEE